MGSGCLSPFSHEGGLGSIPDGPREICGGQSGTWTGFLQALLFPPVNIIPTLLHSHLHLQVALTRGTNGESLGTFHTTMIFNTSRSIR